MWGRSSQPKLTWKAVDSRGRAVQRSTKGTRQAGVATLLLFVVLCVMGPRALGAGTGADGPMISGVVRDAQGVAQMGALVQVLAANSTTVATAFTDQHGRYFISNLSPGRYLVRASAILFVPAMKANLELQSGVTTVVNLTLAALFDTASWLPAERRRADESDDDWKWTLRSTANRPILRIVENGSQIEISSSASEAKHNPATKVRAAVESGDGEFGQGGIHTIFSLRTALDDGAEMSLRANLGSEPASHLALVTPLSSAAATEVAVGYESKTGFDGGAARMLMTFKSHPELVSGGTPPGLNSGMQVTEFTTAQRMRLGERVEVEVGGKMEAVHTTSIAFATKPFLRVSAHPASAWTIEYRFASDRSLQDFGDVTDGAGDIPVALVRDGRLTIQSGHHQEISVSRSEGRGSVRFALYNDFHRESAVFGGEGRSIPGPTVSPTGTTWGEAPRWLPAPMMVDPTMGTFRAFGAGYGSKGARLTVSSPITSALWMAAEYSSGEALEAPDPKESLEAVGLEQAVSQLNVRQSESATLAVKGRVLRTGTSVRASYRWQPSRGVTAVDPYSAFGDQAYLSCLLRQPIRWAGHLPAGLDGTIDVTNLLAEGYRPFLSPDGQTLYFAQAPRTIEAGLSFSF